MINTDMILLLLLLILVRCHTKVLESKRVLHEKLEYSDGGKVMVVVAATQDVGYQQV